MYSVKTLGINIKDDDWIVPDGSLQESINLQWRDNSLRPLPNRIVSDIDTTGYKNIIFHKVSDENKINVFGFGDDISPTFLAFDLAGGLTGSPGVYNDVLIWFGAIEDGVFSSVPLRYFPVQKTPGMSFTILNGLLYFMGNGSNSTEQYYTRLQYNESNSEYEVKDMYAWKSLIPSYPLQGLITVTSPSKNYNVNTRCGLILVRYTLVLNTGEEVMHSPIYGFNLNGINQSDTQVLKDALIENIHAFINLDFDFADQQILDDEISAINIYTSVPSYDTKFPTDVSSNFAAFYAYSDDRIRGEFQRLAETPFYLVRTIDPSDITGQLLLTVGDFSPELTYDYENVTKIDVSTIAAGEVMPVDNFTYHRLYGRITSGNGRLVIESPTTVMTSGHLRSLKTLDDTGVESFKADTEDGLVFGTTLTDDKKFELGVAQKSRGIISYPDTRANIVYSTKTIGTLNGQKTRGNKLHNMACAFAFQAEGCSVFTTEDGGNAKFESEYTTLLFYLFEESVNDSVSGRTNIYTSENRMQFSSPGEFSVWPAINSYRVGEGKIMRIGTNSVDPANADVISPLIIGTSDGVYTVNFDPTGISLISSITKTKNTPYLSSEVLQVDGAIVFVSDKGLMAINNGTVVNLTKDFFPEQGNGNFPVNETVLPGYNTLTNEFFGGNNPYILDDIVKFMIGALFAFDGRRDMIWCSNSNYNFSLLFDTKTKTWSMSTLVFSHAAEYYSLTGTGIGDIYTRFMVKSSISVNMLVLDGEDLDTEVFYHLLTRPVKFSPINNPSKDADKYKQVERMFSRCVLLRDTVDGYFSFGLWGKQDINKQKQAIPMAIKSDDRAITYPNDVRQDIPINNRKGKYKTVTILQAGKALPNSSINEFDFDVMLVDNTRKR